MNILYIAYSCNPFVCEIGIHDFLSRLQLYLAQTIVDHAVHITGAALYLFGDFSITVVTTNLAAHTYTEYY